MLSRKQQFYYQILQLIDAFLLSFALYLAFWLRSEVMPYFLLEPIESITFYNYLWLIGIILPLGPLLLEFNGLYRGSMIRRLRQLIWPIIRAIAFLTLVLAATTLALKIPENVMSRGVFVAYIPCSTALIVLREYLFRRWLIQKSRNEADRQHILICSDAASFHRWQNEFQSQPISSYAIKGHISLEDVQREEFLKRLHQENIDLVVVELHERHLHTCSEIVQACETEGVEVWVTADFLRTSLARPSFDKFYGRPLLIFRTTPDSSFQLLCKSLIDRIGALILLITLSPLFLLIAAAILVTSGPPIFYSQPRSGRYGRVFRMHKFRTMIKDAEKLQPELQARNEMRGPVFKIENDPRITPIGRFLRRWSLDELPQLWNVLRGEMSLVGPRPLPVYETENFSDYSQRRRMSVRPGLTCLWQVAGRNEIKDFSDWVRLDLEYIDNWSLWLDIQILLRTIPAVLARRGAK
ncbi:MAG: sugar transferase [Methylacidiphilales bacterium]|nr:sugar transferase [Candidatus Methylacidiphilales bacterium]MDW8349196.1 sugar transferase [Verrucomicrobiae bacterium]